MPPIDLTRDASLTYDVVTIGNALVDVIAAVEDRFLEDESVVKGSMTLVDADRSAHLFSRISDPTQTSGGSAANTAYGLASLGGRAGFIGKIAQDSFGEAFSSDMQRVGVGFHAGRMSETEPTGRCIIAVTPDGRRSMSTFLGAASLLDPADISREAVQSAAVVFLEGYLFDRDHAKEAFRVAAKYAHEAGRKVSLTLSDSFCVDRHRDDFLGLVRDDVDIVFGNADEVRSLYQVDSFDDAIEAVRGDCHLAAITNGEDGSVIVSDHEVIRVAADPVARVVDTTGAGDLYAAGFLYGLTTGRSLVECGRLGSLAAAEVISHVGPRPLTELRRLVTF